MRASRPNRSAACGAPLLACAAAVLLGLAGCAGAPPRAPTDSASPRPDRDGPEPNPPAGLMAVPDAEPKLEPIRPGGPNKPYDIGGETYVPIVRDEPFAQRGLASWYGRKFHGARTASGERYDMYAMTAAHPTLPIPSYARVRNPANGREVVVRINDRGPFHSSRIIDLSYTAALKLDLLRGTAPVELRRITGDEIRQAAANRPGGGPRLAAVVLPPAPAAAAEAAATAPEARLPVPLAGTAPVADSEPATGDSRPGRDATPTEPPEPPDRAAAAGGWWVQFGAFRAREGAVALEARIADEQGWLAPLLAVFNDAPFYRLQAGPYADRDQAGQVVERVRRGSRLDALIVVRP